MMVIVWPFLEEMGQELGLLILYQLSCTLYICLVPCMDGLFTTLLSQFALD